MRAFFNNFYNCSDVEFDETIRLRYRTLRDEQTLYDFFPTLTRRFFFKQLHLRMAITYLRKSTIILA